MPFLVLGRATARPAGGLDPAVVGALTAQAFITCSPKNHVDFPNWRRHKKVKPASSIDEFGARMNRKGGSP